MKLYWYGNEVVFFGTACELLMLIAAQSSQQAIGIIATELAREAHLMDDTTVEPNLLQQVGYALPDVEAGVLKKFIGPSAR